MKTLLASIAMISASTVYAAGPDCGFYQYKAKVVSVYDGDTVRADIDLGFNIWRRNEPLRLHGIDTPEIRGGTDETKAAGLQARDALRKRVLDREIVICTIKDREGKFGRYLAVLWDGDVNVNEWLMTEGHAVPYE